MAGRAVGDAEKINRRDRQQPQGFKQHAGLCFDSYLLTHQAIKGKAERQAEGNNRQRAEGPELYHHAAESQNNRHPLHTSEALAEENHPQHDIHQRIDKVPQARFKHVVVIHCPDKQQPVTADQHGRERQQENLLRGLQQRFDA